MTNNENYEEAINLLDLLKQKRYELKKEHSKLVAYNKIVISKLKELIELDDSILMIQNDMGLNIGMMAASMGLEEIVEISLQHPIAIFQKDVTGNNIAMLATKCQMEKIALKALDNYDLALEQNKFGENIGMIAARNGMGDVVLKSLDNKKARYQQDKTGQTIAMISAYNYLYKVAEKVVEEQDEKELFIQDNNGDNLLSMMIVKGFIPEMAKIAYKLADNKILQEQQNKSGQNAGHIAEIFGQEDIAWKISKNPIAAKQKDKFGKTIEDYANERAFN